MWVQDIYEYIKNEKLIRQQHLDLKDQCIEIGGDSREFRGLLAHNLKTTIPKGMKILLCHACHNGKCSNVKHLYWGTPKENNNDMTINGKKTIYENMIIKYGIKKTKQILSKNGKKGSLKAERKKLSKQEIEKRFDEIKHIDFTKFGWVNKVSIILNISHTQVRRIFKVYFKNIKTFKRKKPL